MSYPLHRDLIKKYITDNFPLDTRIVDVGAGDGTYRDLLPDYKMDAIEIFQPYCEQYKLAERYNKLFVENAKSFKFYRLYRLIIMGDVLQTMIVEHAHKILTQVTKNNSTAIIQVPYLYEQGVCNDNVYEEHLQPDLTDEVFMERYSIFAPMLLVKDDVCGVYIINPPQY